MPTLAELFHFLGAVVGHWATLMTGGIAIAILALIERWRRRTIPWSAYLLFALACLFGATFLTWKDQDTHIQQLRRDNAKLNSVIQGMHDRRSVREDIAKFLKEGKRLQDKARPSPASPQLKMEYQSWIQKVGKYLRENFDSSYETRFNTVDYDSFQLWDRINA